MPGYHRHPKIYQSSLASGSRHILLNNLSSTALPWRQATLQIIERGKVTIKKRKIEWCSQDEGATEEAVYEQGMLCSAAEGTKAWKEKTVKVDTVEQSSWMWL